MTDTRTSFTPSVSTASRPTSRQGGRPQSALKASLTRGQAALAFVAVSCVCVLGVLGIHHWRVAQQEANRDVASQAATLKWARGAVDAFAAFHGRLPCPAVVMGGEEAVKKGSYECEIDTGKGWLPVTSLTSYIKNRDVFSPDLPPVDWGSSTWGVNAAIRYVVYRDKVGGRDLVTPTKYQAVNVSTRIDEDLAKVPTGFDLCGKIGQVTLGGWHADPNKAGDDVGLAHTRMSATSAPVNIAYGLAVSATGEAFSELNASPLPVVESPNRPRDGSYRDVTEVVPFDQLFSRLGCGAGLAGAYAVNKAEAYWELARGDQLRSLVDYGMHRVHMGVGATAYSAVAMVEAGGDIANETANIIKSILILTTAGHAPCPEIWHTLAVETLALTTISTPAFALAAADAALQGTYALSSEGAQSVTAGMPIWLPNKQVTMSTTTTKLGLI